MPAIVATPVHHPDRLGSAPIERPAGVGVVIPTLAQATRASLLETAIASVLGQSGVTVELTVAVNGPNPDPKIVARLRADPAIRLVERREAGLPGALHAGWLANEAPYFGTLDDDDYLLPGALATRVAALEEGNRQVVVTNGFREESLGRPLHVTQMAVVRADPLRALFARNWLLPGSWLARRQYLSDGLFRRMPPYLECTWLAVNFALEPSLALLDEPTVVWRTTTAGSISKSSAYTLGQFTAIRRILSLDLPPDVAALWRQRLRAACRYRAAFHWGRNEGLLAAFWFVRSKLGRKTVSSPTESSA